MDKIKVITPKVPQQTNGSDCGIFVLQYIESFFKEKDKAHFLTRNNLQNWFSL
jgi:sentrin-specific protease 7